MKYKILLLIFCNFLGFSQNQKTVKKEINAALDSWHEAAAEANFDNYFKILTSDAIYIGTDAQEIWTKAEFMEYAKPYFDKGKAWNFTSLKRNIYFSSDEKTAWFDELLDTQMKLCRGSGVLIKVNKTWMLKHYVLSMTVPNNNSSEIIKLKTPNENRIISKYSEKK